MSDTLQPSAVERPPAISAKGVTKYFGQFPALMDVTFNRDQWQGSGARGPARTRIDRVCPSGLAGAIADRRRDDDVLRQAETR